MKKIYQIVYKGVYTNEIVVANFESTEEFEDAVNFLKRTKHLMLITTNVSIRLK